MNENMIRTYTNKHLMFKDSPLICSKCKTKENIPTKVVEMLDVSELI